MARHVGYTFVNEEGEIPAPEDSDPSGDDPPEQEDGDKQLLGDDGPGPHDDDDDDNGDEGDQNGGDSGGGDEGGSGGDSGNGGDGKGGKTV